MGLVKQWQLEEAEKEIAEYERRMEEEYGPNWENLLEFYRQMEKDD